VPNFELWLLLHYENIQAPIDRHDAINRLKKHIPGYSKGADNMFSMTRELVDVALQRAEALASQFTGHDEPEPFTGIGELVKLLMALGR
jgi:hypothetical protein